MNIINEWPTTEKVIAFTFDDGPNPLYTRQILEIFQEVSGKATFFMIGSQMETYPEVVSEVQAQGHEIGNHTFTHPYLTQLSKTDCHNELILTEAKVTELTGKKPVTFRPPYLDMNEELSELTDRFGYSMIGALNLEALDWEMPGVNHIVEKTRVHLKNGSILLFHDGFGDRSQTVEAIRILVSEATEQGYKLVTVTELLQTRLNR